MIRWCGALLIGLAVLAVPLRASEDSGPSFTAIRVGFAGRYKVGLWTPVRLTLRGGDVAMKGQVIASVPDCEGVVSRVATAEDACQVLPGEETTVTLYVRFGHVETALEAEFRSDGETLARRTFETGSQADARHFPRAIDSGGLMVCIGADASAWEDAVKLPGLDPHGRATVVRLDDMRELPAEPCGYEGVDTVILHTSRPEIFAEKSDGSRLAALDRWVRSGGKLILCAGARAEKVLGEGGPLATFAPGRFSGVVTLAQIGALETFAGSAVGISRPGEQQFDLLVARLSGVQGKVELAEADLPLVVRTPRTFGQVVYLAMNLDQPPLHQWPDRRLVAARLLDLQLTHGEQADEMFAGSPFGFDDLAGQLRSALDQFPAVKSVPFWGLALAVVGYLLLIGPVDYYWLRRAGRVHWTWITFPTVVLLASGGAYVLAHRLKGDQIRINQIEVVDFDGASDAVRGTCWMNVFSPRFEAFDLELRPSLPAGGEAENVKTKVAWFGLPGEGLGGMGRADPRTVAGFESGQFYDFSRDLDEMQGVPVDVWSSRSFTARWQATAASRLVHSQLARAEQAAAGSIRNDSGAALRSCVLAFGRWIYDVGDLDPQASVEIGPRTPRVELRAFLGGAEGLFDKGKARPAAFYDTASTDPAYVLQAMMFCQAAGGRRFTGLANDYQRFVDLSGLLHAGRAVLVARTETTTDRAGSQWLAGGRALADPTGTQVTMVRVVLPVETKVDAGP